MAQVAPRADAAFVAAWARTAPEVLRRVGLPAMVALCQHDIALAGALSAAQDSLERSGVPSAFLPRRPAAPPPRPTTQKSLVARVAKVTRDAIMEAEGETGRGKICAASGPGAGSFLAVPTQEDRRIDDALFRAAVARRLQGGIRAKGPGSRAPYGTTAASADNRSTRTVVGTR